MLGGIFSMYFQARSATDTNDGAFILAEGSMFDFGAQLRY